MDFAVSYLVLAVIEKLYHIFTREMEVRQTSNYFKLFSQLEMLLDMLHQ